MPTGVYKRPGLKERILAKRVIMPNGCWELITHAFRPMMRWKGKRYQLVRLIACAYHGIALDDPRDVCHHCDNPRCFRPSHLFVGTRLENMQDAVRKGRFPAHRLPEDVKVKALVLCKTMTQRKAADTLGIHVRSVENIIRMSKET